jgi:prenyl protein peptidase
LASTIVAVYIIVHFGHAGTFDVLRLLGIWPIDPLDILKALALVSILFAGPLYESIIVDGGWRALSFRGFKATFFDSWIAFRNNFISPISEELVFRSLVISLYLLAKVSPSRIVFTTPLIFGLAHVHHFVEFVQARLAMNRPGSTARIILMGIVRSLFMLTYTSLFGFFAAFVHLRTGNLIAAIAVHMFCNVMGLPRLWGKVGQDQDFKSMTPDVAQGKRDDALEAQTRSEAGIEMTNVRGASTASKTVRNLGAQWTIVYYVLLVLGAYGFYRYLWPLTESKNALATYWKFV